MRSRSRRRLAALAEPAVATERKVLSFARVAAALVARTGMATDRTPVAGLMPATGVATAAGLMIPAAALVTAAAGRVISAGVTVATGAARTVTGRNRPGGTGRRQRTSN